jgi:hypothetical protein
VVPDAAEPVDPVAAVVPLALPVLLLVVPDAVLPLVSDGTLPESVGTLPVVSDGTEPGASVGTVPGSAGTAGTVGPVELAVPLVVVEGPVTTVVTPVAVAGGMTTAVGAPRPVTPPLVALVVAVVPVVVLVPVELDEVPAPVTMRGAPLSGSTQFTSRFEQ